jgi:hypothetical protein
MKSNAKGTEAKVVTIVADDPDQGQGILKRIGGSQSAEWNHRVANDTVQTLWFKGADEQARDGLIKAALAGLVGIAPKNELEGMMAAQLIAAHSAAMECYRRAMIGEQTFEGRRENLNQANKLSRTFAELLGALNSHRGKGQQKVTVEHVHVHSGGQAMVGVVETPGGGVHRKIEDQPHAKEIARANEPALPRPDKGRDGVPVARDGERSLSDARRKVTWGTEGK